MILRTRPAPLSRTLSPPTILLPPRTPVLPATAGRLDRKIEFPHPNEEARARILQIHSRKMSVSPDVNFDEQARSTDDFNAAQLKAVCGEAGMLALRHDADSIRHEDFVDAIVEVQAKKKASLNYYA